MFERSLVLSSKIARSKDNYSQSLPENFITKFEPAVILPPNKKYKIALLRHQGAYSWHNVEAQYNNNTCRYSADDGISFITVVFPNGIYSYNDINDYLHAVMKENGHWNTVNETYYINIRFNIVTFRVDLDITNLNYIFDFYTQEFGSLFGFINQIYYISTSSQQLPDITRGIDNLYIHCSLVKNSLVNGTTSDVIFVYETSNLTRSYSYQLEPYNLVFNPMIGNVIDTITMRLTNDKNTDLDLNGIDLSYSLVIREDI